MNRYLDVAPEAQEALKAGKPVVALRAPSSPTVCPIPRMWRRH